MRDHQSNFAARSAILPAVLTTTPADITIDRAGFDAATFVLQVGSGGISFTSSNRIDFTMQHSDDGTAWSPVDPTNVIGATPDGNGVVLSQRAPHPDPTTHRFGYTDGITGEKRYVRLRAVFAGTHGTGTPLAATAILGNPREAPVAA